jgi:nucleoside-diphosphate-sugar epimerase
MPYEPRPLPLSVGLGLASTLEWVANTFQGGKEPILTRYAVGLLAKSQTLDITAAREQLGYVPKVSIDEGLAHFVAWWRAR